MIELIQITVAIDSEDGANRIAEMLVEKRLAASTWVSGPITSRYWWKDKLEKSTEWVCTIKTRGDLFSKVEQAIKEVHTYEVPGILVSPVVAGSQDYLDWIRRETTSDETGDQERMTKEQLLQELINSHERLIASATVAHERGVTRDGQKWGPREVVAHIAGWEANAIMRVPNTLVGAPFSKYDQEAFNNVVITLVGDQSFEKVCDILRQTYQRDVEMLRKLDDSAFVLGNYAYDRTKAAISHNYEHAQELDKLARELGINESTVNA